MRENEAQEGGARTISAMSVSLADCLIGISLMATSLPVSFCVAENIFPTPLSHVSSDDDDSNHIPLSDLLQVRIQQTGISRIE